MRLYKLWNAELVLRSCFTKPSCSSPCTNQIAGRCIEQYVTVKSSSDIMSTAVRSSNLWCDDTLTHCLVCLSGPSPLRTCKSLWLRNAFPVTVPASWVNTSMIILLQKKMHILSKFSRTVYNTKYERWIPGHFSGIVVFTPLIYFIPNSTLLVWLQLPQESPLSLLITLG